MPTTHNSVGELREGANEERVISASTNVFESPPTSCMHSMYLSDALILTLVLLRFVYYKLRIEARLSRCKCCNMPMVDGRSLEGPLPPAMLMVEFRLREGE